MLLKWKDLIKNVNLKVLYEKEIIIIILNNLLQNYNMVERYVAILQKQ